METKKVDAWLRPAVLWVGIGLFLIGLLAHIFAPETQYNLWKECVQICKHQESVALALLIFLIVIPCFIEAVFRDWGVCGDANYRASAVLLILASAIPWIRAIGGDNGWGYVWAILFTLLAVYLLWFQAKRKDSPQKKTVFFIVSTVLCLCFYLCHYNTFSWGAVFDLVLVLGMSIICCFLACTKRFWAANVFHVLNNVIMLFVFWNSNMSDIISLKIDEQTISVQSTTDKAHLIKQSHDTLIIQGNISEIATQAARYSNEHEWLFFKTRNHNSTNRYRIEVNPVTDRDQCTAIVEEIKKSDLIKTDTVYEQMYVLDINNDTVGIYNDRDIEPNATIDDLVFLIQNQFELPVMKAKGLNGGYPIVYPSASELARYGDDLASFSQMLKKNIT